MGATHHARERRRAGKFILQIELCAVIDESSARNSIQQREKNLTMRKIRAIQC